MWTRDLQIKLSCKSRTLQAIALQDNVEEKEIRNVEYKRGCEVLGNVEIEIGKGSRWKIVKWKKM